MDYTRMNDSEEPPAAQVGTHSSVNSPPHTPGKSEKSHLLSDEKPLLGGSADSDGRKTPGSVTFNVTTPPESAFPVAEFIGDKRRFIVAVTFCNIIACNGAQWISFGPIVDEVKEFFDVTAAQVNLLSSIYMFLYTVGVYATCATFKHVGLRTGLIISAVLNVLCSVCKIVAALAWPNFALLVLSQILGAVCQLLIISIPPLVASEWFLAEERTLVTIICANSMNIGIAIGSVMPPLIVTPSNKGSEAFALFFCIQGAWAVIGLLMTALCVPKKPRTPPSFAALSKEDGPDEHIGNSVKTLLKNPSFVLIMVIAAVTVGLQWTIASVLPQVLRPFGVSEASVGWMGFFNMATGTLVAAVGGLIIAKNKKYKSSMLAALFIFVLVLSIWILYLILAEPDGTDATTIAYPLYILSGWCVGFLLPVSMEFGVELTFPIHESISSTALSWSASIFSVATVALFTLMLGNNPTKHDGLLVLATSLVSVVIGALCMIGVVPNLHRDTFESASASASASLAASPQTQSGPNSPVSCSPKTA